MKPEIAMLVGALGLAVVQVVVAAFGAYRQVGLTVLAGNRENMPFILGWAGRADRASRNMLESLVLFAPLVLAAHVSGISNPITVLGAYVYLWGRVAYAFLYVAGVPWARSGAWLLSLWGMVMIATQFV
jgi:uncharacterized MAPEG superfamily protein